MAIIHQVRRKYANKTEETVGELINFAGAVSSTDPMGIIKKKAAEVADIMSILHGGDWRVEIDHDKRFVLIAPCLPSGRKSL
ncbi:hypothetical protein [Shinella pollutisoli]|uniref:Uncharacterized protein n=1 Tax=Shinella pollutisoli TaxID=2250594 RepID=A0ABV7DBV6_9HYPH|nr:hypothetical protein [Shinella pollutisoli]